MEALNPGNIIFHLNLLSGHFIKVLQFTLYVNTPVGKLSLLNYTLLSQTANMQCPDDVSWMYYNVMHWVVFSYTVGMYRKGFKDK